MVLEKYNTDLIVREVPIPRIEAEDEVLVKVKACGVCATDLKVISGHINSKGFPRIVGHEAMGEVVEIGEKVGKINICDRVVISTYVTCGECKYCKQGRETLCTNVKGRIGIDRDGGFAEYMKVPASNIVKVPDEVADEEAAILPCGAGVPLHALKNRANIGPTDTIVILGVGGVGIHAVQLSKVLGAQVIAIDISDTKLELAKKYGADYVVKSNEDDYLEKLEEIGEITAILDTAGLPKVLRQIQEVLVRGAKIIIVGYGPCKDLIAPLDFIALKEFEIYGSRGVSIQELRELMKFVALNKIKPVVKKFPLEDLNNVLNKLRKNQINGRAVIVP